LTGDGDDQNLKLAFSTHEVLIRGCNLRRIETGIQRMTLALVSKLPTHQRSLIEEGQPVVLEITVRESGCNLGGDG
ncbi:MAG TPA: hypothetical protein VFY06_12330, partial [Verrucomicrobiae bacterium]|nr:hypothetical protein [Verrucomicrobiae bacterium]